MNESCEFHELHPLGTVEVLDLGSETIPVPARKSCIQVQRSQYVWRPTADLDLGPGFELRLECQTDADGIRRFFPADPDLFPHLASLAGHQLREYLRLIPRDGELRKYQLLYQHATKRREFLARHFKQVSDLRIPNRLADRPYHILPETLGLDANGTGTPWTVKELLASGRDAAEQSGEKRPDEETCIRLGLLEAAPISPVPTERLKEIECRSFLRRAIFDLGPVANSTIFQVEHDLVVKRMNVALAQHLADSSNEFWAWFRNLDTLVRGISKKIGEGGPIDREHVRQVILEEIFTSHLYVATNVDAVMRQFLRLLPISLSEPELACFSATFLQQSRLGGFSLFLLRHHVSYLREIGGEILQNPLDDQRVGIMLRMLEFYGDMSSKRRSVDSAYKELQLHEKQTGRLSFVVQIPMNIASQEAEISLTEELKDYLRERYCVECECGSAAAWECKIARTSEPDSTSWTYLCSCCGYQECLVVSDNELQDIEEEISVDNSTGNFGAHFRRIED